MAVLGKEDFFNRIRERIGDDTSEDAISFIEDVTDTYNSLESSNSENWKSKYDDMKNQYDALDESWKKKYKERFFQSDDETTSDKIMNDQRENVIKDGEKRDYEDLFEEREG